MTTGLPGLENALAAYHAGNFSSALKMAEEALTVAEGPEQQTLAVLKAGLHLKLGEKIDGAKAFVAAARLVPDKKAGFFKFAVDLFMTEQCHAAILEIAEEAAASNRGDRDFLLKIATACKLAGNLLAARPFIADLDLTKPEPFALFGAFERAIGNPDGFYQFLSDACLSRGDNTFLNSMRYAKARGVCDFQALEAFDRLVSDTGSPASQTLLRYELALFRLIRTDDEAIHLRPSYDTIGRHETAAAERPVSRRPISPPGRKLRIGYLSSDFSNHVTMRLFEDVLLMHDRDAFDIMLFCHTPQGATVYQKGWPDYLRDCVITVRDMSDAAAAQCIAQHEIDILVDLKGHTASARLGILNRSDAPVKVTYLGYPGSVTATDVDYALTDAVVTPDSSKAFYSEKLCRLPETYQANGSLSRQRPLPLSRHDFGLPERKLILGSFNAAHKITSQTLDLWATIMRQLPDAVFCILCKEGMARDNVKSAFSGAGADPEQIIFFANEPYPRYLARIASVDLALDTHPYNGHTTSSDILWAGTPLITFRGRSFASRVSESLLRAMDLPELVADNTRDYCDLAVGLALNEDERRRIRGRIDINRTRAPLFDTQRFTRHIERAYTLMAERARDGLPPDHIDFEPLPARTEPFGMRR